MDSIVDDLREIQQKPEPIHAGNEHARRTGKGVIVVGIEDILDFIQARMDVY